MLLFLPTIMAAVMIVQRPYNWDMCNREENNWYSKLLMIWLQLDYGWTTSAHCIYRHKSTIMSKRHNIKDLNFLPKSDICSVLMLPGSEYVRTWKSVWGVMCKIVNVSLWKVCVQNCECFLVKGLTCKIVNVFLYKGRCTELWMFSLCS